MKIVVYNLCLHHFLSLGPVVSPLDERVEPDYFIHNYKTTFFAFYEIVEQFLLPFGWKSTSLGLYDLDGKGSCRACFQMFIAGNLEKHKSRKIDIIIIYKPTT